MVAKCFIWIFFSFATQNSCIIYTVQTSLVMISFKKSYSEIVVGDFSALLLKAKFASIVQNDFYVINFKTNIFLSSKVFFFNLTTNDLCLSIFKKFNIGTWLTWVRLCCANFPNRKGLYGFPQTLHHEQDVTQGQFLNELQLIWIQSFPFSRLVVQPKLKNPVSPII